MLKYSHCCEYNNSIDNVFIQEVFEEGLEKCKAKLTEYFNRGCLFSFAGMILDPRIKMNLYMKEHWNEELDDMITM